MNDRGPDKRKILRKRNSILRNVRAIINKPHVYDLICRKPPAESNASDTRTRTETSLSDDPKQKQAARAHSTTYIPSIDKILPKTESLSAEEVIDPGLDKNLSQLRSSSDSEQTDLQVKRLLSRSVELKEEKGITNDDVLNNRSSARLTLNEKYQVTKGKSSKCITLSGFDYSGRIPIERRHAGPFWFSYKRFFEHIRHDRSLRFID